MKTTWKYGTGSRSAWRSASHWARARALALRAVPVATAVVGDANHAAVVAPLDMAAERRGAARLDGGHDAALVGREPTTLCGTERIAVAAEDVRHLQRGTHRSGSVGRDHLNRELIEWARRPGDQIRSRPGRSAPSSPDRL